MTSYLHLHSPIQPQSALRLISGSQPVKSSQNFLSAPEVF
nr:MAG TPA: hypothetical protein [Caudoviricetes sp.]